jgi:hypothetical protein
MPLRIGFDMDGVLADFAGAYHEVEVRLMGPAKAHGRPGDPEEEEGVEGDEASKEIEAEGSKVEEAKKETRPSELRRRRDTVWQAIHDTPDFWMTLKPLDAAAVRRIHEMMMRYRWEVFFITQRPATEGDTVQRQTQRWLVAQGFDLPSVLVIAGSRGGAAAALKLDYHVDDSAKNCIDVKSESAAKPLLIVDPTDDTTVISARRLGIGTAHSIDECLTILEQASINRTQPTLLHRLAKLVGWQ